MCVLSAPGGGTVRPLEAPAPVYPVGGKDLQNFHQDNSGGSPDHHLLRCGATPGEPEWGVLQVHTAFRPTKGETTGLTVCIPNGNSSSPRMFSDCAAARCSRAASDDDLAQKLWEISCNMLGITWQ